jgi:hypothetical protein
VARRNLTELVGKCRCKGGQVYLEGKPKPRSYKDENGNRKYVTEVVVECRPAEINEGFEKNDRWGCVYLDVTGKRRTTVQQSTFGLTMDEKMPTLRKIKRGVLPTHKPTQKHHI